MNIATPTTTGRADKLRDLEQAAEAAGVVLPKPYAAAATEHRETLARARVALEPRPGDLVAAITDAITAGRDLDTDDAVRVALSRVTIAERRVDVLRALAAQESTILREHRDSIVKAAGKAAEEGYEALRTAARLAPGLDRLTSSERVLNVAPEISAAWIAARDAQARIKALGNLLRALPKVRVHNDDELYLHIEPSLTLSANARRSEWDAALEGVELTWCGDLAGFRDRVARAEQQHADAAAAARAHEVAQRRRKTEPVLRAYTAQAARADA